MIHTVTVTNHLGESIEMDLRFPERSGFLVLDIDGLEPPKATINIADMALSDGGLYNSAFVSKRTIVFTLGFSKKETIEETRLRTYKYFPIKRKVTIKVVTDSRVGVTEGYVESNTPVIFSKFQTTVISVVCPNPYIFAEAWQSTLFSAITPLFEFPFSNESLTEPLLIMGEIVNKNEETVLYTGDAKTGFLIHIHMLGTVVDPRFINMRTLEEFKLVSAKLPFPGDLDFVEGDDVYISSIVGDKYIHLVREGVTYNILNTRDKESTWLTLEKGDNIFAYTAESGIANTQFLIDAPILYEGL